MSDLEKFNELMLDFLNKNQHIKVFYSAIDLETSMQAIYVIKNNDALLKNLLLGMLDHAPTMYRILKDVIKEYEKASDLTAECLMQQAINIINNSK